MTRWLLLVPLFAMACGGNSVPPDTKPEEAGWDGEGSDTGDGGEPTDTGVTEEPTDTGEPGDPGDPAVDDDGDGYSEDEGDCDDTNANIHPGATESPADGIDSDCNDSEICLTDADDDGIMEEGTPTVVSADGDCDDPYEGTFADPRGDCDDTDPDIGLPDTWYRDIDEDGLGDGSDAVEACEQPDGYVDNDLDACEVSEGRAGGSGTEADPFVVCDAVTLQNIELDLGAHYRQTEDINLTGVVFTPIVDGPISALTGELDDATEEEVAAALATLGFYGHFNGAGHFIVGLSIDEGDMEPTDDLPPTALFRVVGPTGSVHGVRLEDVSIHGARDAAGVVGLLFGELSDTQLSGIINISGARSVGGVASWLATADEDFPASISNVHVGAGNLTHLGTDSNSPTRPSLGAGGIVGAALGGSLSDATTDLNVKWEWGTTALSLSDLYPPAAGGAVGRAGFTTISNIHTAGRVQGIHTVGGVVGEFVYPEEDCSLSNVTASGEVSGVGETIGGVVGSLGAHACQIGATGSVSGKSMVGGVAGTIESSSSCTECFAAGDIEKVGGLVGDGTGIGGLVGLSTGTGTIQNSLFTGHISSSVAGSSVFGGILGVAFVLDDDPMMAENNMMMGSVNAESGGLIIGGLVIGTSAGAVEEFYVNNVYVDHNPGSEPNLATGSLIEPTEAALYWGEEIEVADVATESAYDSSFDFGVVWTMATTTDADSPMYGLTHPVLRWQCDHDPAISCETGE